MTFNQIKTWHFVEEDSVGGLDDEIVSINMIAMVRKIHEGLMATLNAILPSNAFLVTFSHQKAQTNEVSRVMD